ncbi:hypothetical protein MKW92_044245 [Papaver armeniacum]|nr:hypothetical protein MKW92_044245 [Papaver armeniacum]
MKMGKMNLFCFFTLALVLVLSSSAFAKSKDVTALQIGVKFKPKTCDIQARKGDRIKVHYRGSLNDGTVFDSSFERVTLSNKSSGSGQKRKLKIPAKLGYGGATVIFETELVAVNGKPSNAASETTRCDDVEESDL